MRGRFALLGLLVACRAKQGDVPSNEAAGASALDAPSRDFARVAPGDARLEPLLAFAPMLADLRAPFGATAVEDIQLWGQLARQAKLQVEKKDGPGLQPEIVTSAGGEPIMRLRLFGERVGSGVGRIVVSTALEEPAELVFPYTWRVTGNLSVTPEAPYLDLLPPGPREVVLQVRSTRPDLRIRSVRVVDGPFEARFARQGDGGYAVTVRALPTQIPRETRGVLGTIAIASNDPAEPRKELTLFAMGGQNRTSRALPPGKTNERDDSGP